MRIFPVPYRFLEPDRRFSKYQWINAKVRKAQNDSRIESYNIDVGSIQIESFIDSKDGWNARKDLIYHLKQPSLCAIYRQQEKEGHPTLGIFKPKKIEKLSLTETDPNWSRKQKNILNQQMLPFLDSPTETLEKIPFDFRYKFYCDESDCRGHENLCTDWEIGAAYRNWKAKYGEGWEEKFRQRFELEMISKFDTHFFVGNIHQFPGSWIIVGLFYPPQTSQLGLFSS